MANQGPRGSPGINPIKRPGVWGHLAPSTEESFSKDDSHCNVEWLVLIGLSVKQQRESIRSIKYRSSVAVPIWRYRLTSIVIPIIKIKRSPDRLIFIMEILYLERRFYTETGPWRLSRENYTAHNQTPIDLLHFYALIRKCAYAIWCHDMKNRLSLWFREHGRNGDIFKVSSHTWQYSKTQIKGREVFNKWQKAQCPYHCNKSLHICYSGRHAHGVGQDIILRGRFWYALSINVVSTLHKQTLS